MDKTIQEWEKYMEQRRLGGKGYIPNELIPTTIIKLKTLDVESLTKERDTLLQKIKDLERIKENREIAYNIVYSKIKELEKQIKGEINYEN